MRNRAKCKLCSSIIESFHSTDYVICKCGHIAVDGGDALRCSAKDWTNFLRVDDEGNEIVVKISDYSKYDKSDMEPFPQEHEYSTNSKPTKKQLIDMLDDMRKGIEDLPQGAMSTPINHYDFCSLMLLISSILRAD